MKDLKVEIHLNLNNVNELCVRVSFFVTKLSENTFKIDKSDSALVFFSLL